jgi:hypothetical protein
MASETNAAKIQKLRSAGDLLSGMLDAAQSQSAPQLAEFLTEAIKKVPVKDLAGEFAKQFKEGNAQIRRKLVLDFVALMKQHQQMAGEPTRDEISRMTQPVIDANIEVLLGIKPHGHGSPTNSESQIPAEVSAGSNGFEYADGI